MTDKQIIIDGVDVSGCISLDRYYIANCTEEFTDCALGGLYEYQDEYKCTCKDNPNCYYKQLKRKEQECEELKGKNNYSPKVLKQCPHYKNDNICTYLDYETKCEGNCNYTAFQDFIAEIDELKETFDGLLKVQYKLANNCKKLRQTLTEIKEILKEICMEECSFDWNKTNKKHCGDCDCRYGQILQKISEVEDD